MKTNLKKEDIATVVEMSQIMTDDQKEAQAALNLAHKGIEAATDEKSKKAAEKHYKECLKAKDAAAKEAEKLKKDFIDYYYVGELYFDRYNAHDAVFLSQLEILILDNSEIQTETNSDDEGFKEFTDDVNYNMVKFDNIGMTFTGKNLQRATFMGRNRFIMEDVNGEIDEKTGKVLLHMMPENVNLNRQLGNLLDQHKKVNFVKLTYTGDERASEAKYDHKVYKIQFK